MSDSIGELIQKPAELCCEWRISDFTALKKEVIGKVYSSSNFLISNACLCLQIYPNGMTDKYEGWVGLYLRRMDSGPPENFNFTFGIKKADGKEHLMVKSNRTFSAQTPAWGLSKFLEISDLLNRKTEMAPLDVLTIMCTLKCDVDDQRESSLFGRLWDLSLSFKNILAERERTDVVLKLKDGKLPAHKIILESRCEVFNRMFAVDMRESETGEVNIEDSDEDTFKVLLSYTYSGDPKGLCSTNVCEVYKAAHKYDLKELRKICAHFMQHSLTVDTVCDVIVLTQLYEETTLKECAKEHFAKHKTEIFKTEKWKTLKEENPAIALKVTEYVFGD